MDTIDYVAMIALGLSVLLLIRVVSLQSQLNELRHDLQQLGSRSADSTVIASSRPAAAASTFDEIHAEADAALEERLRSLLAGGKKIQAIKELREAKNMTLKEAKDMVEALDRR